MRVKLVGCNSCKKLNKQHYLNKTAYFKMYALFLQALGPDLMVHGGPEVDDPWFTWYRIQRNLIRFHTALAFFLHENDGNYGIE